MCCEPRDSEHIRIYSRASCFATHTYTLGWLNAATACGVLYPAATVWVRVVENMHKSTLMLMLPPPAACAAAVDPPRLYSPHIHPSPGLAHRIRGPRSGCHRIHRQWQDSRLPASRLFAHPRATQAAAAAPGTDGGAIRCCQQPQGWVEVEQGAGLGACAAASCAGAGTHEGVGAADAAGGGAPGQQHRHCVSVSTCSSTLLQ